MTKFILDYIRKMIYIYNHVEYMFTYTYPRLQSKKDIRDYIFALKWI